MSKLIQSDVLKAKLLSEWVMDIGQVDAFIDKLPGYGTDTTEWLGNHTPFRCKRCGHYSDTRTPFCAYCGRRADNNVKP